MFGKLSRLSRRAWTRKTPVSPVAPDESDEGEMEGDEVREGEGAKKSTVEIDMEIHAQIEVVVDYAG